MPRGLSSGNITTLQADTVIVEDLVEIYLVDNTGTNRFFYYTTGATNVTVTTPSAGSQTFVTNGFISDVSGITETFQAQATDMSIQFSRLGIFGDDGFLRYIQRDAEIINRRVIMYKLFRDTSTFQEDATDGLLNIFDGKISGLEVTVSETDQLFTLRLTGEFGDYDKVRGRSTADIFGALYNKTIYWGSFYLE